MLVLSGGSISYQGRIQDFKLGGAHLKKSCRAEGGAKNFEVFRVKNHDFTQKNLILDPPLNTARPDGAFFSSFDSFIENI